MLNAIEAYDRLQSFDPFSIEAFLKAHEIMLYGLLETAGKWRSRDVGILQGTVVSHVAPPADRVAYLMEDVFAFLKDEEQPLLIRGCVFHYELEFIHPFEDGNGRMGRLWHSLLLNKYHSVFEFIPVESLIRDHQEDYYSALGRSDKQGDSTPFLEFSLSMIHQALEVFLDELRPAPLTAKSRLEIAQAHFGALYFTKKDYMQCFKMISSATASRDLKFAVEQDLLSKQGEKAQTRYQFRVTTAAISTP